MAWVDDRLGLGRRPEVDEDWISSSVDDILGQQGVGLGRRHRRRTPGHGRWIDQKANFHDTDDWISMDVETVLSAAV